MVRGFKDSKIKLEADGAGSGILSKYSREELELISSSL